MHLQSLALLSDGLRWHMVQLISLVAILVALVLSYRENPVPKNRGWHAQGGVGSPSNLLLLGGGLSGVLVGGNRTFPGTHTEVVGRGDVFHCCGRDHWMDCVSICT